MHYRVRIRLLLRRVISQSVWRGHGGLLISKRHGTDPHCSAIIGTNALPPPKYPPDNEGLPHASIKIVCYLLPHWRIGTKTTEIPINIVSKYRVTQHILAIGIPCYKLRSHLKEHLTHNHITIISSSINMSLIYKTAIRPAMLYSTKYRATKKKHVFKT